MLDWDDRLTATDMHHLARQCWLAGSYHAEDPDNWDADQAQALRQRAITILTAVLTHREQHFGVNTEITLETRWQLAEWYAGTYDFKRAIELGEQVLGPLRDGGRWREEWVLSMRHEVGHWHLDARDPETAVAVFSADLDDREVVYGSDAETTLNSLKCLAYAVEDAGDIQRAIQLAEETLTRSERKFGVDAAETLSHQHALAMLLNTNGDIARAQRLFRRTLRLEERVLGNQDRDTFVTRAMLAATYDSAGDLRTAVDLSRQALDEFLRVLGPDDLDTLSTASNLAGSLMTAGDLTSAISLYRQCQVAIERLLGPDHPQTCDARERLSDARLLASLSQPPQLRTLMAGAGMDPADPAACLQFADARDNYWEHFGCLIGMAQLHGRGPTVTLARGLTGPQETEVKAFLDLYESGYDPWRVMQWYNEQPAARVAAVTAVEEGDEEDLAGLLALNEELGGSAAGDGLRLLAAVRQRSAQQVQMSHAVGEVADALDRLPWQAPMSAELEALAHRVAGDLRRGGPIASDPPSPGSAPANTR